MKKLIQFSSVVQEQRSRWLLLVVLVAITHLFCQTLMLPYGKALMSLLPDVDSPVEHQGLPRLSYVNGSTVHKSPLVADVSGFAERSPSLRPAVVIDNEETSVLRDKSREMNVTLDVSFLDDDLDFVEDATLGRDSLLEESVDENEELGVKNVTIQDDGFIEPNEKPIRGGVSARIISNRDSPVENLKLSGVNDSSVGEQTRLLPINERYILYRDDIGTSSVRKKKRCNMPPKTVTYMHKMNHLLVRNRASRRMRPQWSSARDREILAVKAQILSAPMVKTDPELYGPLFRNASMFKRSYQLMERTLKVYVYKDGEKPIFHQPIQKGIYASEGWFMKLMEGNKKFVVKDPRKAHLFYMPFSSRMLEHTLYVRNSHNRTNLRQFLKSYAEKIAAKYPFWNRTAGADHFLVTCHDWAPYETRHHMQHCIKALCNADVTIGFKIGQDVSLPESYVRSARNPLRDLGGKPASERHILAFYAGNMHGYLRKILLEYWENTDPDMKIYGPMPPGVASKMNYIEHMKSSKFCICPKGYEVNSPRVVESIFYECVPVIISDNFVPPFFEVLDWNAFSVIVAEKDLPDLKEILGSISKDRYLEMQLAVRRVQRHFLWHVKPEKYDLFHMTLHSIWYNRVFQIKPR